MNALMYYLLKNVLLNSSLLPLTCLGLDCWFMEAFICLAFVGTAKSFPKWSSWLILPLVVFEGLCFHINSCLSFYLF